MNEKVAGKTVLERMNAMVDYLMRERYNEKYGLLYGAMTADWGDVQPNDDFGCDMNDLSDLAIDVYDNAMFIIALDYLLEMAPDSPQASRWKSLREGIERNVRAHLWDVKRQKFIPHIYPEKSPIPEGFDELAIHYHGGTAIAIEAGLLSKDEIRTCLLYTSAYKTPIYWWIFAFALLIVSLITMFTVTFQNWRAANANPVDSIKTE